MNKFMACIWMTCFSNIFGYSQTRLYVSGDSEAAIATRRVLSKSAMQYENHACFDLESDAQSADLTLRIGEHEVSGGLNAILLPGPSTTVVTGQLVDKSGKIVWEDSKQGMAGLVHDGAGSGVHNLLRSLWGARGCSKRDGRQ